MIKKTENSGKPGRGLRTVLWLGFLTAFILIIFRAMAFGSRIPYWMDPVTFFYPYSHYLVTSLKSGVVPLWNPFIASGYPFIGDIEAAVMYPINWILSLMFSPERFLGVKIVVHFVLAGVFTFLFLIRLKCSRPSAFLGAIAFTLSGALVPKIALISPHQTAAIIPACFFCFSFLCDDLSLRRAVFCGPAIGLLLLSGFIQIAHFAIVTLLLYLVLEAGGIRVKRANTTKRKILVGNAGYWLCTLPVVAFVIIAVRGTLTWTVGPLRISMQQAAKPINIGAFLFVCGWILKGNRVEISFKRIIRCIMMWVVAIFVGFCIAAPQFLPSMEFAKFSSQELHRTIGQVQGLGTGALLKDLTIANVTNFEWQASVGTLPVLLFITALFLRKRKSSSIPGFIAMLCVLVFSILSITKHPPVDRLMSFVPGFLLFYHLGRNVSLVAFPLAALGAISANYIFCRVSKPLRTIGYGAVIILTTLQLLHYNRPLLKTVNPGEYMGYPASVSFLKENCKQWRVFGFDERYSYRYERQEGITNLLVPNTSMLYRIRDVQGYGSLQLKRYKEYLNVMSGGKNDFYPYGDIYHMALIGPGHSPLLDILGVKYVLSRRAFRSPGFALVQKGEVKVYENQSAFPQASVSRRFVALPDSIRTAQLIHDGNVDPGKVVILSEEDLKHSPGILEHTIALDKKVGGAPLYEFKSESGQPALPDRATVDVFKPSYLKIVCDVRGRGGVLFINEILYPGWRARIDGSSTPIIRANYLFRAIIVPEGTHVVEMEFVPRLYYIGLTLSGLWLFILVFMWVAGLRKQSA